MKGNWYFLVFYLCCIFSDYFSVFSSISISSLSFFLLFNPNQKKNLSLLLLLLNHFSLLITFFLFGILFCLLLSLCIALFNFSVICLWKHFSFIHLKSRSVVISFSFPFYCYLFCVFHISKLLFRFSLFHSCKTCSHSHREIRTNMRD